MPETVQQWARDYVTSRYDYARLIEPIAAWVERPEASPDLPPPEGRPGNAGLTRPANSLAETAANCVDEPSVRRESLRARLRRFLG